MSSKKNGFMLIEVLVAMAIVAVMLTPLFILQGTVLQKVVGISRRIHRVVLAQNFLVEVQRDKPVDVRQFVLEQKQDDPPTYLKYNLQSIDKKSSLSLVSGLLVERVVASSQNRTSLTETILTFIFKPESKEK